MFWLKDKLPRLQSLSLITKLTVLYTVSTITILLTIGIFLYPTFNKLLSHLQGSQASYITIECYAKIMLALLISSFTAMFLGQVVARNSLNRITEFEEKMAKISADCLHERINLNEWPRELSTLGLQFNSMLNRLELSFEKLSQFSADIAHELRTPLQNLQALTEIQLTHPNLPNNYQHTLEKYQHEFQHLTKLTEALLFLARSDNGQIKLNLQSFNVQDEILKILAFYEAILLERNIHFEVNGVGEIFADLTLFKRVICNVLSNAISHVPNNGQIFIEIISNNKQTIIKITDNGEGMDEHHLDKLADRFYRIDSSRQAENGRLGLGLAIVKSIVNLHEGEILFHSKKGKGTTVSVIFNK